MGVIMAIMIDAKSMAAVTTSTTNPFSPVICTTVISRLTRQDEGASPLRPRGPSHTQLVEGLDVRHSVR
jgi:hypothetical protein